MRYVIRGDFRKDKSIILQSYNRFSRIIIAIVLFGEKKNYVSIERRRKKKALILRGVGP
jgi:hypothetical protein